MTLRQFDDTLETERALPLYLRDPALGAFDDDTAPPPDNAAGQADQTSADLTESTATTEGTTEETTEGTGSDDEVAAGQDQEAEEGDDTEGEDTEGEDTDSESTDADGSGPEDGAAVAEGAADGAAGPVASATGSPVETAQIDRSGAVLDRLPLYFDPIVAPFNAPLTLRVEPEQPSEELPPEIRDYKQIFAQAATAAQALHRDLRRTAAREALSVKALADQLSTQRQRGLDQSLGDLLDSLDAALSGLDNDAERAKRLASSISAIAVRHVEHSARSALRTMRARARRVAQATRQQREQGRTLTSYAEGRASAISAAGRSGTQALTGLEQNPTGPFPFDALSSPANWVRAAQNDILAVDLPGAIPRPREGLDQDQTAQSLRMTNAARTLDADLTNALAPFNRLQHGFERTGPAAVRRTKTSAISRLRSSTAMLRDSIEDIRSRSREALIEQHNNQRAALSDGAREAAEAEQQSIEDRGNRGVGSYDALAASQGTIIAAIHDSFRQHRAKPAKEFAQIVRIVAERTLKTSGTMTRQRQAAIDRDAVKSHDASTSQTASSVERLGEGSARGAAALGEIADATGAALLGQAEAARPGFMATAEPVLAALAQFPIPLGNAFTNMVSILDAAMEAADTEIHSAFTQAPSSDGGDTAAGTPSPAPHASEAAEAFVSRAQTITEAPETEESVARIITRDDGSVATNVTSRAANLYTALQPFDVETEHVMRELRGLTPNRGGAVRHTYQDRHGGDLADRIKWKLNVGNLFTMPSTRINDIRAALRHLAGDPTNAARYEIRAATVLWNDSARIDLVMESMSPPEMAAFNAAAEANSAFMEDVRGDLDDTDRDVFNHLRRGDVVSAQAIRMGSDIDRAREQRGDRGGDATADYIRGARTRAGSTRLEGADEHALGAQDFEDAASREARRETAWRDHTEAFAELHPVTLAEGEMGPMPAGEALIRYATREMDYQVYVPNQQGEGGHYETHREGLRSEQDLLIRNLVTHGPDSPEARAAQLLVERTRTGGAKHERVRQAVDDPALNPAFNEDLIDPDDRTGMERARRDAAEARERQTETYRLLDRYSHDDDPNYTAREPEVIRAELGDELAERAGHDRERGRYLRRMVTHDLHEDEVAVAAFEFAVEGSGTHEDVLTAQFGSMSRDQIDAAVAEYDDNHTEPLYDRLGIHGRGGFFTELSGDDANQIQVASLGRPRNPREEMEVAAMTSRLEIDDSTWIGRGLAGDAARNLAASHADLLRTAGVTDADFDSLGRLRLLGADGQPVGRFNERGGFVPAPGANEWDLASAMITSTAGAEAYRVATDSIANAITTAIVATAAIVSTALTGGAAASIWIPMLITMSAGVAAMGVNYAIKGGRYGYEQAFADFGMTLVQTVTAGAGATAGAYLRGGSTALKAVSSRMAVSEKLLERFMAVGGRGGLRTLGFADDLLINGFTGALGSGGAALFDDQAWDSGEWGNEIGHGMTRGLLSGLVSAGVMRPFTRAAQASPANAAILRGIGSGLGGAGSRAAELGYDRDRGKFTGSLHDALNQITQAGGHSAFQGYADAVAENMGGNNRLGRLQERLQGRRPFRRGSRGSGSTRRPGSHPDDSRETRRPARDASADQADLEILDAAATAVRLGIDAEDVVPPGLTPDRPVVPRAGDGPVDDDGPQTSLRPADDGDTEEMARPPVLDDDTEEMTRPPVFDDDTVDENAITGQFERPLTDDDFILAPPLPGAPEGAPRIRIRRKPVEPIEVHELWDETGIMTANPRDPDEARQVYGRLVTDSLGREAAIYFNPVTGEYVTFQGIADQVFVQVRDGRPESPLPGGRAQRWKELLDADIGHWELLRHYHPRRGETIEWRMADRLPSGLGGDMGVLDGESHAISGAPRRSRIDFIENGEWKHTDFGVDPGSPDGRYWIDFENPATGLREQRRFGSIGDLEAWRSEATRPIATPSDRDTHPDGLAIVDPSSPVTPRADGRVTPEPVAPAVTLPHGATEADRHRIAQHGLDPDSVRGNLGGDVPARGPVLPQAGPGPSAADADPLGPSRAARQADLSDIVDAVRARRGDHDADRLSELLILGGDTMERLVHASTEGEMARHSRLLNAKLGSGITIDPARRDELVALIARRRALSFPDESERMLRSRAHRLVERWEDRGFRPGEIDALGDEIAALRHQRTGSNFGFGTARKQQMAAQEWAIEEALFFPADDPAASPLQRHAADIRDVDRLSAILRDNKARLLRQFARGSLVGDSSAEWDLVDQWHRYLNTIEAFNAQHPHAAREPSFNGFDNYIRGYMRRAQIPRFSEVLAATELAGPPRGADMGGTDAIEMDLEVLKWAIEVDQRPGIHGSRNEPNEPGSDILGFRRHDNTIVYVDDKAWSITRRNQGVIGRVGALTTSLRENMLADARALRLQLGILRNAGLHIDPAHAGIPSRLEACAAELASAFPQGIDLSISGHAALLAEITRRHGVELAVTNAAERGASDVSAKLKRAGFRFLHTTRAPISDDPNEGD